MSELLESLVYSLAPLSYCSSPGVNILILDRDTAAACQGHARSHCHQWWGSPWQLLLESVSSGHSCDRLSGKVPPRNRPRVGDLHAGILLGSGLRVYTYEENRIVWKKECNCNAVLQRPRPSLEEVRSWDGPSVLSHFKTRGLCFSTPVSTSQSLIWLSPGESVTLAVLLWLRLIARARTGWELSDVSVLKGESEWCTMASMIDR